MPGFVMHRLWRQTNLVPLDAFTGPGDVFLFPNYLTKPARSGKTLITVHDMVFRRYPETVMPKNLSMLSRSFEKGLERSDAVMTVSEFSRTEFLHYYPRYSRPVFVAYNGIDDFFIDDFPAARMEAVRRRYALPENYLLFVGTVEPRKNLPLLLRAFDGLARDYPELGLVLVGPRGWRPAEFNRVFDALPSKARVRQVRFVQGEDLPFLYRGASLFVFPSLYEGFGMPPLEAMSCGTPVLAASIPVLREILKDRAEYCDPFAEPREWTEAAARLLSDREKRERMRSRGIPFARKYRWEETARQTLRACGEIAG
jgi:glycosyltransferase involved in cell wall biosynthesis